MSVSTVLQLDEDLVAKLEEERQSSGRSLEDLVNDLVRRGLEGSSRGEARRFTVRPRSLHARPGVALDDVEGLLDRLDRAPSLRLSS